MAKLSIGLGNGRVYLQITSIPPPRLRRQHHELALGAARERVETTHIPWAADGVAMVQASIRDEMVWRDNRPWLKRKYSPKVWFGKLVSA